MEWHKDIPDMYVGQNESMTISNGIKNHGVEDILMTRVDDSTGFL